MLKVIKMFQNTQKKHFAFAFAPSRFPSKSQLLIPEALSTSLLEELYRNKPTLHGKPLPPQPQQSAKVPDFSESCLSAVCGGTDAYLLRGRAHIT